jgi:hypothetical protein
MRERIDGKDDVQLDRLGLVQGTLGKPIPGPSWSSQPA